MKRRALVPASLIAALLLLQSCSCSRRPDTTNSDIAQVSRADASDSDAASADPSSDTDPAGDAQPWQDSPSALEAVSTLRGYLSALAAGDGRNADTFWSGGKANALDDYAVRALEGLRELQIRNDAPRALDQESPPRSIEIPVRLRAGTGDGVHRIEGYYRLRRKIDDSGWEITSASLQPAID